MDVARALEAVGSGERGASFEIFARSLDPQWIEAALAATGSASVRRRKLPAEQVVWIVIGMGLFRDRSIQEVVHHLDLVLPGRAPGARRPAATSSGVVQARDRLGAAPLKALFEQTAARWAGASADAHRWRGLSLYGVDGSALRIADTPENEAAFGRPASSRGKAGYPQLRLVALMVLRSHLLAGLALGAWSAGEATLAEPLWAKLPDHSLTILDRGFLAYALLHRLATSGVERHWLIRAKSNLKWRTLQQRGANDQLVEITVSRQARRTHPDLPETLVVRAIRYQRKGFRPQTLLTSLLDPVTYPAAEVAQLYHERWELELGFDEIKTHALEREETLRCRAPERVLQEVWGLAIAYNLVRLHMQEVAGRAGLVPSRISFRHALLLLRGFWLTTAWATAPGNLPRRLDDLHQELALLVIPPTTATTLPPRRQDQDEQLPEKTMKIRASGGKLPGIGARPGIVSGYRLRSEVVRMSRSYREEYQRSLLDPEGFWAEAAEDLHWTRRWDRVLDESRAPFVEWFPGGELNTCANALDVHVESGRGDQPALIYDSPVTGVIRRFTYLELRDQVARLAGALRAQGTRKGDRVLIYMPMVPEAVMGMLACARIGAVHSVVFGGFAAAELATRIDDAAPRLVLSASCGIEGDRVIPYKPLLDAAIGRATSKPERCVILQRPQQRAELLPSRDLDWEELMAGAEPVEPLPVGATDPLYILYTSGTTGLPKGVVRDNGGHAVALKWSLRNVYGIEPGEVFWAASDIGWVVGHSYIVYAPLLLGCTTILYEGKPVGTPDAGAFWRVIAQHRVQALFTAPTALRAVKREDPRAELVRRHDLSGFRTLFLAGERADPDTVRWAERALGVPVIDHWWQTETGWAIAANCVGVEMLSVKPGSPTAPVPGYDVRVLGQDGEEAQPMQSGSLVIRLPLPPGCLTTLWRNDEGFRASYLSRFPGYYETADAGHKDEDGYLWIMSRTDDIINVAGHRLSTGRIEEVLASHPDVAECAVIGVADELKGQVPVGLVVLNAGVDRAPAAIVAEVVQGVREEIGPVAAFKRACVVERLPKTRSGKVLRGTMRSIADSEPYRVPATIDDPAILEELKAALQTLGYAR